jgi:hypothetical protein
MMAEKSKDTIDSVGHFLATYLWKPKLLVWNLVTSIVHCLCNALSIKLWFAVGGFFLFYLFSMGVGFLIEYLCGGVCFLIKNIINVVSEIASVVTFSRKHYNVFAINALAALVDGECEGFKHPLAVLGYWWTRMVGTSICSKIQWYNTITLTRIFLSKPLSLLLLNQGEDKCHRISMTNDMCAAVIGSMTLLDWMLHLGIWIFVCVVIFSPLFCFVLHSMKMFCKVMYTELFCIMYSLTHGKKK